MARILVTGSRDWEDHLTISNALHEATGGDISDLVIVHGACPTGADYFADLLAWRLGIPVERHPADWRGPCTPSCKPGHRKPGKGGGTYCPNAGNWRNQKMVDLGADLVLAFIRNGSSGTSDCMRRAAARGIRIIPHEVADV